MLLRLGVLVALCFPALLSAQAEPQAERIARVEQGLRHPVEVVGRAEVRFSLEERMAAFNVPGVSIAVLDSGRVVWAKGYGVKEAGGSESVTAETLFQAASISKPVSVFGLLRMVEAGRLDLDANVNRLLTSWKVPENRFTRREDVTLRRIVSHSAGLTIHGFPGYDVNAPLPSLPDILDGMPPANTGRVEADTFPGALWRYSGGGITVMQLLMMDVSGQPFDQLMSELVLDPVGMSHSTFSQPLTPERAGEAASAHRRDGSVIPRKWHVYPEQAAAGLWTTPSDLARLAIEVRNAYEGQSSLLSRAMAREMLRRNMGQSGLGFMVGGNGAAFRYHHGGSNEGFRCQFVAFLEDGKGAVIMTNGDAGQELIQEILLSIADEYDWPAVEQRRVNPVLLKSSLMEATAGEYRFGPGAGVVVKLVIDGGRLYMESPGVVTKTELIPTDDRTFVALGSGQELQVDRNGNTGWATALVVTGARAIRVR